MDYTSIHIYGHLLSDDILHNIERDNTLIGNRDQDFGMDISVSSAIDYAWSCLRNDWNFYKERADNERLTVKDPYGTRRSRDLMERMLQTMGYKLNRQNSNITVAGTGYDISYTCPELGNMPFVVIGENASADGSINTLDKCSLDHRAKGAMRKKSAHATMLEYLNATENVYGVISNGQIVRLIRNSGQLVKLTYIEFDLRRMLEEDKYTEFCLMFRLLHASRFRASDDEPCVMERWFNMSIESGNRIRNGLSRAVQTTMETIGNALLTSEGESNDALRRAFIDGTMNAAQLNKELIHFIYRLLFLFIIEERGLVYQIPDSIDAPDYKQQCQWQDIYKKYYAASRLRRLSELSYLKQRQYSDLWQGLMDTFHLFEPDNFGEKLGIKPLGGVLFGAQTLHWLKQCKVSNKDLLAAFSALNEFTDERQQRVKINYSSLDVEEFGSVYEGILEMRPFVQPAHAASDWQFGFVGGLGRKSTSSYYTRPDLVQNLIKTTLEPVIMKKMAQYATTEEKEKALLNMKVCDAASGSGHIVLAMARTIAWYVCTLRTGEDNPASLDYRQALREVISRCVYAVDYNPDAVELCKVVLWIEGYCAGKPLSFLDHHIRCGNSVLGVSDLQMLIDGVPDKALTAEDKDTLKALKKMNQEAIKAVSGNSGNEPSLGLENTFGIEKMTASQIGLADKVRFILEKGGKLRGNIFELESGSYVPLYEGKMFWIYNHHYGSWPTNGDRPNSIDSPELIHMQNPNYSIMPWYWVPVELVIENQTKRDYDGKEIWSWKHDWIIAFRKLTNATNERTLVISTMPGTFGAGDSTTLLCVERGTIPGILLQAMLSSLVADYTVRQKVGGTNLSHFFFKQFPILTPDQIPSTTQWQIVKRVAELCYFNHDMDGWASELWEEMSEEQRAALPQLGAQQPWIYNPERRAVLQAELDAIFAHLYGLNTEDLVYILDPEDICGKGCINETFRVLKDNEVRQYGEYRTKRLVLEAWNKFGFDN